MGGDARGDGGVGGVDGDCVGGPVGFGIFGDHLGEGEPDCMGWMERCADEATV